jgi:predicted amidophosphoribosyltransferase
MGDSTRRHLFGVPHWVILPALAALPAIAVRRLWTARRRATLGRCASCGYDLRASPERCPECGQAVGEPGANKKRNRPNISN